jgi:hypothetical protein
LDFDRSRGYFYGALLGDGHINYTRRSLLNASDPKSRRGPMLMLKVCDLDFIEAWRDAIKDITGFEYKISKHNPGQNSGSHRQQYKLRVANRELVDEAETLTKHKSQFPPQIAKAKRDVQIAFVQGLMDSEGWINFYLSGGLGQNDMTLGFGCADPWFDDFYQFVQKLGVRTSRIYRRKPTRKKNGEPGKPFRLFKMEIPSYLNAGLSFTIRRKADRLAFCSRILNDYTRDYPRYEDYYRVDDIV